MSLPPIIINFKTYESALGHNAVSIAKVIQGASKEAGVEVALAVGALELVAISAAVDLPVYAQHVDGVDVGSHTGDILPKAVQLVGGKGSLINHSEDPMTMEEIKAAVQECSKYGLVSVVCAPDAKTAAEVAVFKPSAIAVEPPELIGTGISISTAQPELITQTVQAVHAIDQDIIVYCGAGVVTRQDVIRALALGAHGVLLASGVMKVDDPAAIVANLCEGVKSLSDSDKSAI